MVHYAQHLLRKLDPEDGVVVSITHVDGVTKRYRFRADSWFFGYLENLDGTLAASPALLSRMPAKSVSVLGHL